ncbi:GLUG motif-containing protein [Chitinophaga tropicalis]|uniref:GLUG domain-containing protein n=1 Tax=Chitinophaga tropicalis TaxID=2683588 RepID=A0A7K1U4U4_9BACT|nr:GLUG motif-containing protein [Chitinophaga tropicalis]MVT09316.1 hypothetical protein [Chitinophaga tropicalis]
MKQIYLCSLAASLLLIASCSKNNDNTPDPGTTTKQDSTKVSFTFEKTGTSEMFNTFTQTYPSVKISKGKANRSFTYELTGSNGLKKTSDTLVKGTGQLDMTGSASFYFNELTNYKDGEITLKVTFKGPDTTITAKTQKIEFQVRNYQDFMHMGFHTHRDTSVHFVQVQDFAFPDTVFSVAAYQSYFAGSYDGQGYKITNLTIKASRTPGSNPTDVGLFMDADSGSVLKNIRLELSAEGISSTGAAYCGGIAGRAWNNTIYNCSVKGNIQTPKDAIESYIGGIAGYISNTKMAGCSFRGNITGAIIGGITGMMQVTSVIDMSYAYFSFDASKAGGIVYNAGSTSNISNSYVVAHDYTAPAFVAVGPSTSQLTITNSYANAGTAQTGVTIASLPNMNAQLAAMEITVNWPQWITAPANHKPYKYDTDQAAPMKLWWE